MIPIWLASTIALFVFIAGIGLGFDIRDKQPPEHIKAIKRLRDSMVSPKSDKTNKEEHKDESL